MKWIQIDGEESHRYAIFTDSKSMVDALRKNNWKESHEWLRATKSILQNFVQKVILCWVPSHCGVYGNEKADQAAEQGTKLDQRAAPVTLSIAKAKIKSKKWIPSHERARKMFKERRKPKETEKKWPESIRRLYSRIRCDHAKELKAYQKRIGIVEDGTCSHCEMNEEETVEHVLCKCPQLEQARKEEWPGAFKMEMLVSEPDVCRKVLGRRFSALRRIGNEEDGCGSPVDCKEHQA